MAGKKSIDVKFRPSGEKTEKGSGPLKGACRILIRKDSLIELTGSVENGRRCFIERADAATALSVEEGPAPVRREAVLWHAPDPNLGRAVAKVSRAFQEACGFNFTDTYRIVAADSPTEDAQDVVFEDATTGDSMMPISGDAEWAWKENLKAELWLVLRDLAFRREKRTFIVRTVNGLENNNCRVVPESTKISISAAIGAAGRKEELGPPPRLHVFGVSGLDDELAELNRFLRVRSEAPWAKGWHGLVVYGGRGTGKTMLLNRVAQRGWGVVHRIEPTDKSSAIQGVFEKATSQQPSIVIIDELERLIDKDRANRSTVLKELCSGLDSLSSYHRDKGAQPSVVVLAACQDYMTEVPYDLRKAGRLERAILIPPLDVKGRFAVITSAFNTPIHPAIKTEVASSLAERTHAYNGDDLLKLDNLAGELMYAKLGSIDGTTTNTSPADGKEKEAPKPPPLSEDPKFYADVFDEARLKVRPTAMQDVHLKPPPVRWDDISGQESVKRDLRLAVRMITAPKEKVQAHIGSPPKGFLLYGPPGCSKTMMAQAMATESGLNFFAVKGAELLNMYVGESERQVRNLFARARAASPSMIFFDEIDSIAGSRKGFGGGDGSAAAGGGGGGGGGGSSHGGLNVLTTLLNEMDGFEDLRGVLVLAATNRPQTLDPAIMRPGRFDEIIYVPPPDATAREGIFRSRTRDRRLAADVDFAALAAATEGSSGAEIAAICRTAGNRSFHRDLERADRAAARGGSGAGVGGGAGVAGVEGQAAVDEGEVDERTCMADFEAAVAKQRRLITREMLQAYSDWEMQFR